jgi:hypothetical protein
VTKIKEMDALKGLKISESIYDLTVRQLTLICIDTKKHYKS